MALIMNDAAFHLPKRELLAELERRIAAKTAEQAERDERFGSARIRIGSYMENIGWPELFGFTMQRYFDDADFSIEQYLRQQIFWADNVPDDTIPGRQIMADTGMYWDITLFGQRIVHSAIGVPEFLPHPLQQSGDLRTLGHFDFYRTGEMPRLLAKYQRMQEIAHDDYAGKLEITFPAFHRGPLDIYVQLRGYAQFLDDVTERPRELAAGLTFLADERLRFARERQQFLHEAALPPTTFVADDWVNLPFISPAIFREFVVPVYARIRANEGPVTGFHTCGNMLAVTPELLAVFPEMTGLDVSGWNDVRALDALLAPHIAFACGIINTISLGDARDERQAVLEAIREVARTARSPSAHRPS